MNEPITIEMNQLDKHFVGTHALKQITTQARAGDIIGLVGRNGAGKTTLLETLTGLLLPDGGSATLLGADCRQLDASVRNRLGVVLQDDELFGWLKVSRQIALVAGFYQHFDTDRVHRLLDNWQVPTHRKVETLSRGQRQMLGLALALGHDPEVLLLDEPASALDPVARREFLQELVTIACDSARTIIFSTHLIGDLEKIANRLWLMRNGELVIDAETDELREFTRRLTVRARTPLPPTLGLAGTLRERIDGRSAEVILNSRDSIDIDQLGRRLDAQVSCEYLGLESLCLEYLS